MANWQLIIFSTSALMAISSTIMSNTALSQSLRSLNRNRRSLESLRFSGCFGGCGRFKAFLINPQLINEDCIKFCKGKAFIYAATRGNFCGCTQSLESLLPTYGREDQQEKSSGPSSKCNMACPGSRAYKEKSECIGDECCGGSVAYSVFASGEIEVTKELANRVYDSLGLENLKSLFNTDSLTEKKEDLHVEVAIKHSEEGKQGFQVCEVTKEGASCEEVKEDPKMPIVKFTQMSYKREAKHGTPSGTKPLKGFDAEVDLTNAEGTFKKSYTVVERTTISNTVQGGFDTSISVSTEFSAGQDVAMYKWLQKVSAGFSFTGKYMKSDETSTATETRHVIDISIPVPKNAKAQINFFKEQYDLTVKWQAEILATGKVKISWSGKSKEVSLKRLLRHSQRIVYAAGILKYGDRQKITALVKVIDRDTGDVKDTREVAKENVDADVDATESQKQPCSSFGTVDLCQHRMEIDLTDKDIECVTTFGGKEACTMSCLYENHLLSNKEISVQRPMCPSGSGRETRRTSSVYDFFNKEKDKICKGKRMFTHDL